MDISPEFKSYAADSKSYTIIKAVKYPRLPLFVKADSSSEFFTAASEKEISPLIIDCLISSALL